MTREIKFRAWREGQMYYGDDLCITMSGKIVGWLSEDDIENKIMQFTGLLDKNGKEIYEGDIVEAINDKGWEKEIHMSGIKPVVWNKKESCFSMGEQKIPMYWGGFKSLEVIGNIYENPELIK